MSRIVSVWLKSWPIARFLRAQARRASAAPSTDVIDPTRPFVLVSAGPGGPRLAALNPPAWRGGLAQGELLSNARTKVPDLKSRDADPDADAAALQRLALWCLRYTPIVSCWHEEDNAYGLFLDITGCAHLFGGEATLLADIRSCLRGFKLTPRLAVADTAGAAWAVARYGTEEIGILAMGSQEKALSHLPLAALRLGAEAQATLSRLGFRRIGELLHQPRAPLVARFGTTLLERFDQALGRAAEPLSPLDPPAVYRKQATFAEAIMTQAHVLRAAAHLMRTLVGDLERNGVGIRILRLLLFRLDGEALSLKIGLAAPSRDVAHIVRLIEMRLERLPGGLEADFGFEAAALDVLAAERIVERQTALGVVEDVGDPAGLTPLIDRLEHRLGAGVVRRLHPRQSHIPERAVEALRADEKPADWQAPTPFGLRPPLLLATPEEVRKPLASVPDGPPQRFSWRGVQHDVAHAEGPERITPEWWLPDREEPERDYYVVEDTAGRRFWLYHAGRYSQEAGVPRPVRSPLVVVSGAQDLAVDPSQADGTDDSPAPSSTASNTARSYAPLTTTEATSHTNTSGQASPRWFVHGIFP